MPLELVDVMSPLLSTVTAPVKEWAQMPSALALVVDMSPDDVTVTAPAPLLLAMIARAVWPVVEMSPTEWTVTDPLPYPPAVIP
jgi:hypothetical protein